MSKILFIYAHPDDETFFTGGIIQKLIKLNNEVTLICITKGEASSLRHGYSNTDNLGEIRLNELKAATKILGIKNLITSDFSDGKLKNQVSEITQYLKSRLSSLNPDFVITLEPYGAYGHSDHIELTKIINTLVNPTKIIYTTINPNFKFGPSTSNMSVLPDHRPLKPKLAYTLSTLEYLNKIKAMRAHKSQNNPKNSLWHNLHTLVTMKKEYFVVADGNDHKPKIFDFLKPHF